MNERANAEIDQAVGAMSLKSLPQSKEMGD